MILIKTALRTIRKNIGITLFTFIQLVVLLLISAALTSAVYIRFRTYLPFKDYFESEGMYCAFGMPYDSHLPRYIDTSEMMSGLSAAEAAAIHYIPALYDENLSASATDKTAGEFYEAESDPRLIAPNVYSYDDEIIRRFTPELSKGRWFDLSSDNIEAVVSDNNGIFSVGEYYDLWFVSGDETGFTNYYQYRVMVVGELKENTEIFFGGRSFEAPSYRNAFFPYSTETEGHPLILLSSSALKNSEREVYQPIFPFAILKYDEGVPDDIMQSDRQKLTANGAERFYKLAEMDKNSKAYLYEQVYNLLPIAVIMLVLTIVSCISASALSTRKRLRDYAVCYLVGLPWKKCVLVNFIQSLMIGGVSVTAMLLCSAVINLTPLSESFVIMLNQWTFSAVLAVLVIFVTMSLIMPATMLCYTSPKKLLQRE